MANEEYDSTNCPIFRTFFLEMCGFSFSRSSNTWFLIAYQEPIISNCFLLWNTFGMVFQYINNFTTFENGSADNITCVHHRRVAISIFGWRMNLWMFFWSSSVYSHCADLRQLLYSIQIWANLLKKLLLSSAVISVCPVFPTLHE